MEGYIRPDRRDRRRKRPDGERDIGSMSVDALNKVVRDREVERLSGETTPAEKTDGKPIREESDPS